MKNIVPKMLFLFFFFLVLVRNSCAQKLASALYVFGDSTLDAGNYNTTNLESVLPYGVDLPGNCSARVTNGYNMADFVAEWLGLELPPPYIQVHDEEHETNVTEGINYAIVGATIVNVTDPFFVDSKGRPLTLGLQVEQFRLTVEDYLPARLTSNQTVSLHLANSIFLLSIGGNDYVFNYVPGDNASEFADKVVDRLGISLQDLYDLGGRKFVIAEMGPFGNFPLPKFAPPTGLTTAQLNELAIIYNQRLTAKLKELTSSLKFSTFVQLKIFNLALDLIENPTKYGVVNSKEPCCQLSMFGGCEINTIPCQNRTQYVFFDTIHPTEITNKIIALSCFNGTTGVCVPNIVELARIVSTGDHGKTDEKVGETRPEDNKHFYVRWIQAFVLKFF